MLGRLHADALQPRAERAVGQQQLMRLLLLLLVAAAAAYFTVPTRDAHETAAREFLQGRQPSEDANQSLSLEEIAGYVKGMFAGQGRYENWYLASKYSVDMPGASYLECYGAFTMIRCEEVTPGAAS
jgi:hypothetical protein